MAAGWWRPLSRPGPSSTTRLTCCSPPGKETSCSALSGLFPPFTTARAPTPGSPPSRPADRLRHGTGRDARDAGDQWASRRATATTGKDGRYTLESTLAEGQNWVYVKGTGALASPEWSVTYRAADSIDPGDNDPSKTDRAPPAMGPSTASLTASPRRW